MEAPSALPELGPLAQAFVYCLVWLSSLAGGPLRARPRPPLRCIRTLHSGALMPAQLSIARKAKRTGGPRDATTHRKVQL